MDLKEIRTNINELDEEILTKLKARMELSDFVAENKMRTEQKIFVPEREQEIAEIVAADVPNILKHGFKGIWKSIMRVSRKKQYAYLLNHNVEWALGNKIKKALGNNLLVHKVSYCGDVGSYSEQASTKMFPNAKLFNTKSFEGACQLMFDGTVDAVVLPIDNSTSGSVAESYKLVEKYDCCICKSYDLPIKHVLLGNKGAKIEDIKFVYSHAQGISQCSAFIQEHEVEVSQMSNTIFAAQEVANSKQMNAAAIASKEAAEIYSLDVLDENICDITTNTTRFIALYKEDIIMQDAKIISLILSLPHESGALANVLEMFGNAGLNMTKIHSRPDTENSTTDSWKYLFFIDVQCDLKMQFDETLTTLYQMESELPYLKLLGWY